MNFKRSEHFFGLERPNSFDYLLNDPIKYRGASQINMPSNFEVSNKFEFMRVPQSFEDHPPEARQIRQLTDLIFEERRKFGVKVNLTTGKLTNALQTTYVEIPLFTVIEVDDWKGPDDDPRRFRRIPLIDQVTKKQKTKLVSIADLARQPDIQNKISGLNLLINQQVNRQQLGISETEEERKIGVDPNIISEALIVNILTYVTSNLTRILNEGATPIRKKSTIDETNSALFGVVSALSSPDLPKKDLDKLTDIGTLTRNNRIDAYRLLQDPLYLFKVLVTFKTAEGFDLRYFSRFLVDLANEPKRLTYFQNRTVKYYVNHFLTRSFGESTPLDSIGRTRHLADLFDQGRVDTDDEGEFDNMSGWTTGAPSTATTMTRASSMRGDDTEEEEEEEEKMSTFSQFRRSRRRAQRGVSSRVDVEEEEEEEEEEEMGVPITQGPQPIQPVIETSANLNMDDLLAEMNALGVGSQVQEEPLAIDINEDDNKGKSYQIPTTKPSATSVIPGDGGVGNFPDITGEELFKTTNNPTLTQLFSTYPLILPTGYRADRPFLKFYVDHVYMAKYDDMGQLKVLALIYNLLMSNRNKAANRSKATTTMGVTENNFLTKIINKEIMIRMDSPMDVRVNKYRSRPIWDVID